MLNEKNGQTLTELCRHSDISRQGLSKHLAILEDADLIVTQFRGREKRHYLNPVPIHDIAERWISRFSMAHLSAIASLKKSVEEH